MGTLRIASFNVHHCRGLDGIVDVERVAKVVRSLSVDLIALQELDRNLPRSGGIDQPHELGRLLDVEVTFFPTLSRGDGDYGLALAARPSPSLPAYVVLPQLGKEEPRGVVSARWEGLEVVCTHLSTAADARRIQTSALAAIAARAEGPVAVLGDLNQGARTLGLLAAHGFRGAFGHRTLPRARLRRQIDHILVRDATLRRSWTVPTTASDHLPLVAEISVP